MRDHDLPHALLERRVDDGEDLVAREVAGGEHEAVPRDRAEHRPRLGQHGAVGVDDRHRLELEPRRAQLALQLHPDRHLRARRDRVSSPLSLTESTVGSQTVRAPSRAAISTATGFMPPTARLSAIAPSTSTPGTAARRPRRAPPSRCSATSAGSPPSPSSAKRRASVRSSIRRATTSGAMCTCMSKAPRSSLRARSETAGDRLDAHRALSSAATPGRAAVTRGWTPSSRSSSPARRARARGARRERGCPRAGGRADARRRARASRAAPRRNQSSQPAARAAATPSSRPRRGPS